MFIFGGGSPVFRIENFISTEMIFFVSVIFVLWCVLGASTFFIKKQKRNEECENLKIEKIFFAMTVLLSIIILPILKGALEYGFATSGPHMQREDTIYRIGREIRSYSIFALVIFTVLCVKKDRKLVYQCANSFLFVNVGMILFSLGFAEEPELILMLYFIILLISFIGYLYERKNSKLTSEKNAEKKVKLLFGKLLLIMGCLATMVLLSFKLWIFLGIPAILIYFCIEFLRKKVFVKKKGDE